MDKTGFAGDAAGAAGIIMGAGTGCKAGYGDLTITGAWTGSKAGNFSL